MKQQLRATLVASIATLIAVGLGACAPAKHSTTPMANEVVGGLTMFADPSDDFEFPDIPEIDDGSVNADTPAEPIKHGSSEGRKPAAWDGNTPNAAKFTAMTENALDTIGAQMLETIPEDIEEFCPTYASLDREHRKGVWLMIISAIAKFESGFRPSVSFQEGFKNGKNEFVVSRGLLQLSSESANGFGCKIKQESQLHDPETNLACGVRILAKTVIRDTVITAHDEKWHGAARYWSVLRKPKTLVPIKNVTRGLASCRTTNG